MSTEMTRCVQQDEGVIWLGPIRHGCCAELALRAAHMIGPLMSQRHAVGEP